MKRAAEGVGGVGRSAAAADEDGWMNVNISFTLLSQQPRLMHVSKGPLSFCLSDATPTTRSDGSAAPLSATTARCIRQRRRTYGLPS